MDYIILKMEICSQDEDITFYAFILHEAWGEKKNTAQLTHLPNSILCYVYKRNQII
jgi:hypothetical protein